MKNLIFAIVFLSPPFLKKIILKWFCGARFGRGATIGWFSSITGSRISVGDHSYIKPLTVIRCDGEVRIGNYTEISSFSVIYGCANFRVGNKCYIGPQTWINVTEDVVMGNGVGIGPRAMIFTHGSFLPYTEGYPVRFEKVTIGNNVWIAAGVFIHPGVEVGDNVFVNSRSVISKSIFSGQVVEGFPAKEICPIEKIRRPITPAKRDALIFNIMKHFASYLNQIETKVKIINSDDNAFSLHLHGEDYLIGVINSQGVVPSEFQENTHEKIIILLNSSDWKPPSLRDKMMIFNFTTMKTSYSKDRVCCELYLFLKQYYGIIFEYD
jgi:acetyltransferase-like isoleucine patch superfamily enzyme